MFNVGAAVGMIDLLLIASLGFLGSFGHCAGMCGPIAIAFSLSDHQSSKSTHWQRFQFHLLLNLGRIVSYVLIGAAIGAIGSVLVAGGQFAGLGSVLRRGMAIVMGLLLVWLGLAQIYPQWIPRFPLLHPLAEGKLRDRLSHSMVSASLKPHRWTPMLLGLAWGLIPCGFLYTAQIKAAETSNLWLGGSTMLAFGLGTLPMMLAVGFAGNWIKPQHRAQLFQLGGWITLMIGVLTLARTGDMEDFTGHAAIACLVLALVARPLSRLFPWLLVCRRAFGVSAFVLSLAHVGHMVTMGWNLEALPFLLPTLQMGTWAGITSLGLLAPLAFTSFDWMQRAMGDRWRMLHLLSVPAFLLAVMHVILLGSHYLGALEWTWMNQLATALLGAIAIGVLLIRWHWFWALFSLGKYYGSSKNSQ